MTKPVPAPSPDALLNALLREIEAAKPAEIEATYGFDKHTAVDMLRYGGRFVVDHWSTRNLHKLYVATEVLGTSLQLEVLKLKYSKSPLACLLRNLLKQDITVTEEVEPAQFREGCFVGVLWYSVQD